MIVVFDGPQVLEEPKVISNGGVDLDNPKVQKVMPSSLMVLILTQFSDPDTA